LHRKLAPKSRTRKKISVSTEQNTIKFIFHCACKRHLTTIVAQITHSTISSRFKQFESMSWTFHFMIIVKAVFACMIERRKCNCLVFLDTSRLFCITSFRFVNLYWFSPVAVYYWFIIIGAINTELASKASPKSRKEINVATEQKQQN
jgi:hypothetical protein